MTQRQTGACCQPTRADAGADEVVVVSGATGFVGRELVRELLARLPAARLALLVRDTPDQPAERRFERILRSLPPSEREAVRTRIEALPADAEQRADRRVEVPALRRGPATDARQAVPARCGHQDGSVEVPALRAGRAAEPVEAVPADSGHRPDRHLQVPTLRGGPAAHPGQALSAW